ncbi:MAG: type II toxin-antitoxin system HicB family antitoxin [Candidatus Rokubacteria bacterium]|nr:type II toxin-antitoxin system HicB family antitoxin [Candidatus Rokubacteria bacterium]
MLRSVVHARVTPDAEGGYVATCEEIAVVTQGETLDEVIANLREAVALHLEGEDLAALGFVPEPTILVTLELAPAHA